MKNFLIAFLISVAAFSCMPEEQIKPDNPTANNPLGINAPSGFTWSTTTTLNARLNKLFIPVSIVRAVEIKDEAGTVYFKGAHDLSTDLSLNITFPNHVQNITMKIGDTEMKGVINGKDLIFTFPIVEPSTAD